ncbi:MAG: lytic transglycosylase domain-containing protein [Saprospiraceae bacterium]|nr:lytic transglycosylase domain-containing protein [Saprospiraceae bacterium]
MQKELFHYWLGVIVIALSILFSTRTVHSETTFMEDITEWSDPQKIRMPKTPRELSFADERFPINNFDVRNRIDRELLISCFGHSTMLLNWKVAHRYFPVIEPILKKHGVPEDFKYLAIAESNLRNATSSAGAKGVWQFMHGTAREYNLRISSDVDERYHLEKATEAACRYFKKAYKKFNSWTLAAASYNMGMGGLSREMKVQKEYYYQDLNLNSETNRYVFRILAIKEVMEHPSLYGYDLNGPDLFEPLKSKSVPVDTTIQSLADFAHNYNMTYRMLKVYNPWLINNKLSNPNGEQYEIKVAVE